MVARTLSLPFAVRRSGVLPLDGVVVAHPLAAALGADELAPRLACATTTNNTHTQHIHTM